MFWNIVLVVVVLALIGSLPVYGFNSGWGYGPSGGIGGLLLVLVVLWFLFGRHH